MAVLYKKVNYLLSTVYPDYDNDTGFMRGNLTRLTVGDLFNRTPGVLQSLNVTVNDDYPWEIALDKNMLQTPHILDISVAWTPILQDLPRSGFIGDDDTLIQRNIFVPVGQNNNQNTPTNNPTTPNESQNNGNTGGTPDIPGSDLIREYYGGR